LIATLYTHFNKLTSIQRRLISGSFWNLLATLASRGLNVLAGILVARLLGKEGFGEVGIIQSSVLMFQVFATFGITVTCAKHVAEFKNTAPQRAGKIIGFSLIFSIITGILVALVFVAISPVLASKALARPELLSALRVSALMLVFGAWIGFQNGVLTGLEAFKTLAITNAISGICSSVLIVFGAYLGGVMGAISGMAAGMLFQCALNSYVIKRCLAKYEITIVFEGMRDHFQLVWNFSLPSMLAGLIHWCAIWLGNVVLVNRPNGYAEMGVYNAAYQWFSALLFLPAILTNVILPMLSKEKGSADLVTVKETFYLGLKSSFAILIPSAVFLSIFSPKIMALYGPDFLGSWPILVVIAIMAIVAGTQNMLTNLLAVMNRMWSNFMLNWIWGCLFVISTTLFVFFLGWGAFGLALSGLLSYLVKFLLVTSFAFKLIRIEQHIDAEMRAS
jgi:O-antigen/teichoic acid export membrane protein